MFSAINCSSTKSAAELMKEIKSSGASATLVDLCVVYSLRHLQAAYESAQASMADGSAVSERVEMEFLMWLGQSPHALKAIERAGAKDGKEMALVCFEMDEKKSIELAKKLGLKTHGKRFLGCAGAMEYWNVPTVDGVEREMLLLEQMALSRLKE